MLPTDPASGNGDAEALRYVFSCPFPAVPDVADRLPLFWFWFNTEDDARKGTHRAAYAGLASVVVTGLLLAVSLTDAGVGLRDLIDAWSLLDMALLLGLSYGTYRGSRVAAVGLLGLYLVEQVLMRIESGMTNGLLLTVVFTAMFAQGVAGAFALHRFRQTEDLEDQLAALEAGEAAPRG